ncbi:MAG: cell division protein FtsQ [Prevotella sp.]|nr:cell division protein FtsQ [Prevotella sp.]
MNWKKALLIVADVILGVYLLLAVTAFNKPDDAAAVCQDVVVSIKGDAVEGFLTAADVKKMLKTDHIALKGLPLSEIDTREIEEKLQAKELIDEAQCYVTQNNNVCIDIRQRVPVVRVMNDRGDDYYVDTNGKALPRSEYTCNLIVATGHIPPVYAERSLAPMANIMRNDKFWRNQVVQLHILTDGSVELVPRVGDHIVFLGQPTGIQRKLERVKKFYIYGLSQAGWNKYKRISVEFDNQIICKRK